MYSGIKIVLLVASVQRLVRQCLPDWRVMKFDVVLPLQFHAGHEVMP